MVVDYDIARIARDELRLFLETNDVKYTSLGLTLNSAEWVIMISLLNDEKIDLIPSTINNTRIEIYKIGKTEINYENNYYR